MLKQFHNVRLRCLGNRIMILQPTVITTLTKHATINYTLKLYTKKHVPYKLTVCKFSTQINNHSNNQFNPDTINNNNTAIPSNHNTNNITSTATSSTQSTQPKHTNHWVYTFNNIIQHNSLSTISTLMLIELSSFSITNAVLPYITNNVYSSTWIAAYFLSWPIRRSIIVKLLICPFIAIPLATIIPVLKHVDLTRLLRSDPVIRIKNMITRSNTTEKQVNEQVDNNLSSSRLLRFTQQYGLSSLISYRIAGASVLISIYALLEYGIDVQYYLQHYLHIDLNNISYSKLNTLATNNSKYVVSLVCMAALFPINIAILPYTVRYIVVPITSRISGLFRKGSSSSKAIK